MTEELRQIALGIKSFTPGEFTVSANETNYTVFNTISNRYEEALVKLIEGYKLCRYLNTIKASSTRNKVKFHLMRTSDVILGFYTSFNDSVVEKVELHKTTWGFCNGDCTKDLITGKPTKGETEIIPIEVKNSYCKLDIVLLDPKNHNCEHKVVIHLKKQLPKSNGTLIAIDELFANDYFREKQYREEFSGPSVPLIPVKFDVPSQDWICISHPKPNEKDENPPSISELQDTLQLQNHGVNTFPS